MAWMSLMSFWELSFSLIYSMPVKIASKLRNLKLLNPRFWLFCIVIVQLYPGFCVMFLSFLNWMCIFSLRLPSSGVNFKLYRWPTVDLIYPPRTNDPSKMWWGVIFPIAFPSPNINWKPKNGHSNRRTAIEVSQSNNRDLKQSYHVRQIMGQNLKESWMGHFVEQIMDRYMLEQGRLNFCSNYNQNNA